MIDLHSHTTRSDGALSPSEIIEGAVALRLEALAITDYDTLAGYGDAFPHAQRTGLDLVCGVELSTRPHITLRSAPSAHLLGYFFEADARIGFRDWLGSQQQNRRARNRALVARLRELRVDITLSEVEAMGGNLTGRPHFARILQHKGYVQSRQEAFDVCLADHAQAAVEREEPGLIKGIRRIQEAGGFSSLAHPVRLEACDLRFLRKFLPALVDAGLNGLEVYHSDHSPDQTETFSALAREFGLAETGGSDFHGENKPGVSLGSGRGELALPYALLDNLRRVVRSRVEINNEASKCPTR